jgi:hypothetical protein
LLPTVLQRALCRVAVVDHVEAEKAEVKMTKTIRLGLLVLATVFGTHAFAADFAGENNSKFLSDSCITSKTDAYDIGETMHQGAWKGKCMDVSNHRPVVLISEDDQKVTFANFYHDSAFWIAEVPKSGVDYVIFQIANFGFPIPGVKFAHDQLRFVMKPGVSIKLTPQDSASKLAPTEVKDMIFDDQPSAPKGLQDDYNPIKGIESSYGNVLRAMGASDREKEELGGKDDTTRQFLLNLTDDEKNGALLNAIDLSAQLGYDRIFTLSKLNCTTTAFEILDDSVDYGHHVKPFKMDLWDIHDPIIGPSIKALKKRNLIEKELETWNLETGLK